MEDIKTQYNNEMMKKIILENQKLELEIQLLKQELKPPLMETVNIEKTEDIEKELDDKLLDDKPRFWR